MNFLSGASVLRGSLFLSLMLLFASVQAAEKVTLQLKWEHEFQFAGYYAALWQGYYADQGLDVEIKSAASAEAGLLSPMLEVTSGRAEFSIGGLDILLARDEGEDLIILAPIFQRNPVSFFSLPSTPMANMQELAKLRIAAPDFSDTSAEILALFSSQGFSLADIAFVDVPPSIDSLQAGLADAIVTYGVSARFQAAEKNLELTELSPFDYGLDFYSDSLYSTGAIVKNRPEMVRKFVQASIKGWEYALQHRYQIADRISRELPRYVIQYQNINTYNRGFADYINTYLAYPYVPVGHNNKARWKQMVSQLRSIGVIEGNWEVDSLFADPEPASAFDAVMPVAVTMLGILMIIIVYLMRRQKQAFIPFLLILLAIVATEMAIESSLSSSQLNNLRLAVTQQLGSVSAKLSGAISQNLSIISGLAAHIAINPQIDQQGFEQYARAVFRRDPLLINLAAAPDLVVTMIHPLEPNKAALGLDYRTNEAQRDAVLQAKNSGNVILAGPVNLVQGGVAFIGRIAVFTDEVVDDEHFWGIVSAPISNERLYATAGLLDPDLPIEIAIRGNDSLGRNGKVFFGSEAIFDDERSVLTEITIGAGSWQMVARPVQGWEIVSRDIWILRAAALITALLLLFLAQLRYRQGFKERNYQQQIADSEGLLQEVSRLALVGGWKIDSDAKFCQFSFQAMQTLGLDGTQNNIPLKHVLALFNQSGATELQENVGRAIRKGESFDIELPLNQTDGAEKWVKIIGHPTRDGKNQFEITGAIQDITERQQFTEVIERQATFDLLTGLPNRFLFYNRLDQSIVWARRHRRKLAVLFIDLDNFKPVNDNLGHRAGDTLLQMVGQRIAACIRESDTLARYSGDEFTLVLQDLEHQSTPLTVAENILEAIRQPFEIDTNQVYCSVSIGIAVYPDDGESAESLVSNADQAMYEVKKSGRNDCRYFTEAMQALSEKRHMMRTNLAAALSDQLLEVHFQPIVELASGKITRCEALVRWADANGKLVATDEFIALAEETGMINEIDRFVLQRASETLIEHNHRYQQQISLSVNVSPRLFTMKDKSLSLWMDLVRQSAQKLDVTVEITERLLTEDSERALEVLASLRASGVTIAIDDFGTGYSSLSYLTLFPIDIIKIDKSFIGKIGENHTTEILTDAIISLAQNLSLQVVAEGVETEDQLDYLRQRNCDYAQGYLLGKPQSSEDFRQLLESEERVAIS